MDLIFIAVLVVAMGGMMWWQQRKSKEQQQKVKDFRAGLQPGTEVITIGQIIGKVVSVDEQYEEIVIDSEGSLIRLGFNGISREYVRPAFVSDDEVDENGNPLPEEEKPEQSDDEPAQVGIGQSLDAAKADDAEHAESAKAGEGK